MKLIAFQFLLCGLAIGMPDPHKMTDKEYIPRPVDPIKEGPSSHYVSAIQFAIHESSGPLLKRSQKLVREQFVESVDVFPGLQEAPYDMRVSGNEVVFYVMTPQDQHALMQQAVAMMIQNLNGRVRAKGRTSFYRTELPQPFGGYLATEVNDNHNGVVSIVAHGVPLRDLLAQLRDQLGGLSYLIPGECAEKNVNWRFQSAQDSAKPVDLVMSELARLYHLKLEKRNNTHIFAGRCEVDKPVPHGQMAVAGPQEALPLMPFGGGSRPFVRQVYFPVSPLGQ